jgi:tRNA pseudouridine13 synthase
MERLREILEDGCPNGFGAQRFGRDGQNAERAMKLLRGEPVEGGRRAARFLISALQSTVFNAVLAERTLPLNELECGDVAIRHDSGGSFVVEDLVADAARAKAFEISPTGPIFGTRTLEPAGAVAAREKRVLAEHGIDLEKLRVPRGIRLRGARRALRMRPEDATLSAVEGGIRLRFTLPSGSYATVLVEELLGMSPAEGFE